MVFKQSACARGLTGSPLPMKPAMKSALTLGLALLMAGAQAETGKLPLTGGVSSVTGTAGGGITPWAVIGTQATEGEVGVSAYASRAVTQDYSLNSTGVAFGFSERVELSLAQQDFNASRASALNAVAPFGVAGDQHVLMDVVGLKVRVLGDAILDSDTWVPQVSVGAENKRVQPGTLQSVYNFLGVDTSGTDYYVSATKLLLGQGVLLNATLRSTNANQNGLLGFGGKSPAERERSLMTEYSVAWLLNRRLAVGAEYRHMPNRLEPLGASAGLGDGLHEDDWYDAFLAWAPARHLSFTLAYVNLGRVLPGVTSNRRQEGVYLSTQVAF